MAHKYFSILLFLALSGCSDLQSPQNNNAQKDTTVQTVQEWTNPEFPFGDFADTLTAIARKTGFDTIAVNGTGEITNFSHHRYMAMIINKNEIPISDTAQIVFLYNITLKHHSVKKADSPDMTADIYCFTDSISCQFWKKQIQNLYHQSGGEPLKELYYLETFGNFLLHTTTRAFMWQGELKTFHNGCVVFMGNHSATEK